MGAILSVIIVNITNGIELRYKTKNQSEVENDEDF